MLGVNATFNHVIMQQVEQHFWIINWNLVGIHVQPPREWPILGNDNKTWH
jgi:hypothetical protein